MALRLTLALTFLLVVSATGFAQCRDRAPTEGPIRVKTLKWKTYASGENWNSFFVETLDVCYPKTGVNQAFLIGCYDPKSSPDGCPPVKAGQTYDAAFAQDKLTSITVDKKRYRTPAAVLMPCAVQPPARWEGIKTATVDSVRCVSDTPAAGLVGTVWENRTPQGRYVYVRFEADRKVFVADSILLTNVLLRGVWSQQGEKVSLDFLSYFINAKLNGDQLVGEIVAPTSGMRMPWSAKRTK